MPLLLKPVEIHLPLSTHTARWVFAWSFITLAFVVASSTHAVMHPQLGRFLQRDPAGTAIQPSYQASLLTPRHGRSGSTQIAHSSTRFPGLDRPQLLTYGDFQAAQSTPTASRQYPDGLSLYAAYSSSPATRVDPSGLAWVKTGVEYCANFNHGMVKVRGRGYGAYATSHVNPTSNWWDDLKATFTDGVIKSPDSAFGGTCYAVEVNDECCDPEDYTQAVEDFAKDWESRYGTSSPNRFTYSWTGVLGHNCYTWARAALMAGASSCEVRFDFNVGPSIGGTSTYERPYRVAY